MLQVKSGGKVLWLMIVLASLAVATVFIRASIQVQLLAKLHHIHHLRSSDGLLLLLCKETGRKIAIC